MEAKRCREAAKPPPLIHGLTQLSVIRQKGKVSPPPTEMTSPLM